MNQLDISRKRNTLFSLVFGDMEQIAGRYEHVRSDDLYEHLIAYGIDEATSHRVDSQKGFIDVEVNGDNITFKRHVSGCSTTYILNKEVEDKKGNRIFKSVATYTNQKLYVTSTYNNAYFGIKEYLFSDTELVLILRSARPTVPVARLFFLKRPMV